MKQRLQLGILLAVALFVYGNSLHNNFTMDDELYIFRNPQVTHVSVGELFRANKASNVFRPVTFATLAANSKLSHERPFGYHLFNLIIHADVTVLLFLVLRAILESVPHGETIAFVASLLFAVHPLHAEAVASIVGRSELLAAGFLLGAWLLHLRDRPIFAGLCLVLAMLSKESAVVFLPLALAGDYARGKFKPLTRYVSIAGVTLMYGIVLWKAQGGHFGSSEVSVLDNPLHRLPTVWRILNATRVAWRYVGLQLFPAKLSCDYSFDEIRLYGDLRHALPAAVAALGVIAAWGWAAWKRQSGLILAGAIYFAGFATTANVLIGTGTIMGERLAYLPSAGFCLLIAILWSRIETRHRYAAISLLALVVVALGTRTIVRNRDWKDNYALYQAAVRVVPGSAKAHAYLGNEYLNRREFDLARSEFQIALTIYPDFPDALDSMALVAFRTGNDSEAVRLMESALQMSDRRDINYDYMVVNLAAMLMQTGRSDDALRLLDREIAESPEYSRAWSNRAVIHYQRGESASARSDAEAALHLDPNNSQALGVLNKTSPMMPSTSAQ